MPQQIVIFSDTLNENGKASSIKMFEDGLVDHIPNASLVTMADKLKLGKKEGVDLHTTNSIGLTLLYFTPHGLKRTTSARQRISVELNRALRSGFEDLSDFAMAAASALVAECLVML